MLLLSYGDRQPEERGKKQLKIRIMKLCQSWLSVKKMSVKKWIIFINIHINTSLARQTLYLITPLGKGSGTRDYINTSSAYLLPQQVLYLLCFCNLSEFCLSKSPIIRNTQPACTCVLTILVTTSSECNFSALKHISEML